jgi:O-antigen/teichoic acid export membrane protein
MIQMKDLNIKDFVYLVIPRILAAFFSLTIFSIIGTHLGREDFKDFQIPYTVGAVALWIIDFGLLKYVSKLSAEEKFQEASESWFIRIGLIVISSLSFLILQLFDSFENIFGILLVIGMVDASADAQILLQQNMLNRKRNIITILKRKIFQIILLTPITFVPQTKMQSLIIISFAIGLPSAISHISFTRQFDRPKQLNFYRNVKGSFNFWFSSGGNYFSNLDNSIIVARDGSIQLLALAAGRKIGNTLLIFSGAVNARIFFSTAKYKNIQSTDVGSIIILMLTTISFSIVSYLFYPELFDFMLGVQPSDSERFVFQMVLLAVNLSCFNGVLNSILNGLGHFTATNYSTYVSTLVYLLCLSFLPDSLPLEKIIGYSILINHFAESIILVLGAGKIISKMKRIDFNK